MKKNAFTMVELLAVIVILGILSTMAIIGVSNLIDRSKIEDAKQNKETLKMAAISYMNDNPTKLPKLIGDSKEVSAKLLKEKKYLKKDLKNSKNEDCMNNSYVNVFKKTKTKYIYTPYLLCGDEKKEEKVIQDKPTIELYFIDSLGTEMNFKDYQEVLNNMEKETVYIRMTGGIDSKTSEKLKLEGYVFIVYSKYNGVEHEVYNSGTLSANEQYEIIHKKKLTDYIDVTQATDFNVKVIAINEKGIRNTVESRRNYQDSENPICSGVLKGQATDDNWINKKDYINNKKQRSITMLCSDVGASGCIRENFTRTWPNDIEKSAEFAYIQVSDNATNKSIPDSYLKNSCSNKDTTNKCRVRVNVDIVNPTIKLTSSALNKVYEASDSVGNITINSTDHKNNYNGWLNKSNYPNGVSYKVSFTDDIYLKNYKWETNPINIKSSSSSNYKSINASNPDAVKETSLTKYNGNSCNSIKQNSFTISLKGEGLRQGKLTLTDVAGNKTTIVINAKIDKLPPTCAVSAKKSASKTNEAESKKEYSHNTWSNVAKVYTAPTCTEKGVSGCDSTKFNVKVIRGPNSSATIGTFTVKKRGLESEGISYHDWTIYDKAGNATSCSRFTIKLDRTEPNCSTKKTTTHSKSGVSSEYKCTDPEYTKNVVNCPSNDTGLKKSISHKIKDEAGNEGKCSTSVSSYYLYKKRTKSCETVYSNCRWKGGNNPSNATVGSCGGKSCSASNRGSVCSSPDATYGWTCKCSSSTNCWWNAWSGWSTSNHCSGYTNSSTCQQKSDGKYYK